MNGTWAMLLGRIVNLRVGEAAFGGTQFAYLPVLLLAVYGWARQRRFNLSDALTAVALVACVPTLYASASSGYNDAALALYLTIAVAAATRWWSALSRRALAEMGIALGFALGIKLLAVFLIAPLFVLFLLRLRQARQEGDSRILGIAGLRSAMVVVAVSAALAAPWYVRNYVRTGSPVYPFYINLLGGHAPGWDEPRSLIDQMLNARYGGYPKGLLDYLVTPFRLSLTAQPEIPRDFDGVLGISFLFGLPLLLIAVAGTRVLSKKQACEGSGGWLGGKNIDAEAKVAAVLAAGFFIFWLFSSEQLRYLLPALPPLALAITATASRLDRRFRNLLLAAVVPGLLVVLTWFCEQNPLPVVVGVESRDAYLERRVDHYSFYEAANRQLPADARLWLINTRGDTYYLERSWFSDFRIEDWTLVRWVRASHTIEELRERVRQAGITHVLVRTDLLLNYATSPIVDDHRPREGNERNLQVLRSFLLDGEVLERGDHFILFKVD